MATAPTYTLPTAPTPTGQPAPFVGPYEWDQPNAQAAYESALAQIGQQRQTLYHNYGVDSSGALDMQNNPYGYMEQLAQANAANVDQAGASARHRGLAGSGLEAQGERFAQEQAGAQTQGAVDALLQGTNQLGTAESGALDTLNQRLFQDKLAEDEYAQSHNLFTTAAPTRSAAQVEALAQRMYAAWRSAYGDKSHVGKNAKGMTFQQRLNALQAQLYDPSATWRVGGQSFGGA